MVGDSFTSQKIVWSLFFEDGYFCLVYYFFECWRLSIPFCKVWNVPSFWFTFIKCIFFSHQVHFWSKCPFCWKHKSLYLMIIPFLVNTYVFLKQHLSWLLSPRDRGLLDFSQLSYIGVEEPGEWKEGIWKSRYINSKYQSVLIFPN